MGLKLAKPVVAFDTETTGVDVFQDQICQFGAVKQLPNGTRSELELLIKPTKPITMEATAVHGISNADVKDAPKFKEVADTIAEFFVGADLTGYNVLSYDIPLLQQEFRRNGILWEPEGKRVVDTFRIFKTQVPHRLEKAVSFYCGKEYKFKAHSALDDARASLDLLFAQAEYYDAKTLAQLQPFAKDPSWIDETGKLKWLGDFAVITFGKHSGKIFSTLPTGYLNWVLGQDFPDDFKAICRDALRGKYPSK